MMAIELDDVVRQALDATDWHQTNAADWLVQKATSNKQLRDALITQAALKIIAYRLIAGVVSDERESAWDHLPKPLKPIDSDLRFQQVSAKQLSDFRLSDGSRLAEATKDQLMVTAVRDGKQGRTLLWRSVWLRAIADRMPDGMTVKEVFTEDELIALQVQTQPE